MIPLYNQTQYNLTKSREVLALECEYCHKQFHRRKNLLQQYYSELKDGRPITVNFQYCSRKCQGLSQQIRKICLCKLCGKSFYRTPSELRKKIKFTFCSRSCSAKYWNAHKTTGTRRSKLEAWIGSELTKRYSDLHIDYNRTNAINAELDIYIPSLKLAFELNGIFHYEPIFGEGKLSSHKTNDARKFQACLERGIELCIIDTSSQKKFTPSSSQKFLDIMINIIVEKWQAEKDSNFPSGVLETLHRPAARL